MSGITPTYSGCPATEVIRGEVRKALSAGGFPDALLEEVLSPPWTSDWLTSAGRQKLAAFGIAPPAGSAQPAAAAVAGAGGERARAAPAPGRSA